MKTYVIFEIGSSRKLFGVCCVETGTRTLRPLKLNACRRMIRKLSCEAK